MHGGHPLGVPGLITAELVQAPQDRPQVPHQVGQPGGAGLGDESGVDETGELRPHVVQRCCYCRTAGPAPASRSSTSCASASIWDTGPAPSRCAAPGRRAPPRPVGQTPRRPTPGRPRRRSPGRQRTPRSRPAAPARRHRDGGSSPSSRSWAAGRRSSARRRAPRAAPACEYRAASRRPPPPRCRRSGCRPSCRRRPAPGSRAPVRCVNTRGRVPKSQRVSPVLVRPAAAS